MSTIDDGFVRNWTRHRGRSSRARCGPSAHHCFGNIAACSARVTAIALVVSLGIAFLVIPKQYKAITSIMPPDQQGSGAMMLAALAGRSAGLGGLGSLAGGLLGGHPTTALYVNLLESGTVSGHLIDRFNLQHVYHTRYRIHDGQAPRAPHDDHRRQEERCHHDRSRGHGSRTRSRSGTGYLDELNNLLTQTQHLVRSSGTHLHREPPSLGWSRTRTGPACAE